MFIKFQRITNKSPISFIKKTTNSQVINIIRTFKTPHRRRKCNKNLRIRSLITFHHLSRLSIVLLTNKIIGPNCWWRIDLKISPMNDKNQIGLTWQRLWHLANFMWQLKIGECGEWSNCYFRNNDFLIN
jgi:hypothetical protein